MIPSLSIAVTNIHNVNADVQFYFLPLMSNTNLSTKTDIKGICKISLYASVARVSYKPAFTEANYLFESSQARKVCRNINLFSNIMN